MSNWFYVDADLKIAARTLPNGGMESITASKLPQGTTVDAYVPPQSSPLVPFGHAMATAVNFSAVPVTLGSVEQWRTIYFSQVSDVRIGDVIDIHSCGQITTELDYNVELTAIIEVRPWIGTNPADGASYSGGTEPLVDGSTISRFHSPLMGHNVRQTIQHHQDWHRSWRFVAQDNHPILSLCGRLRARSSGAQAGHTIAVDPGQGALWWSRWRASR